jgi:16S rRNA U1498 N3-methylase RsmE
VTTGERKVARKKKAGRPPRHAGEHLSKNRTFRVWDKLDDQLQAAAKQSRRTVSAEIEYRLERSFWMDRIDAHLQDLLGVSLTEALSVPLPEIGLADEERVRRWAKRVAKGLASLEEESDKS